MLICIIHRFLCKDKENIDFVEAYELLQIMARPNLKKMRDEDPEKWLNNNITNILDTSDTSEKGDICKEQKTQENTSDTQPCPSLTKQEISTILTVQQFISGIKIWKETTSTSPSGRHLGHYKAIIRDEILAQIFTTMTSLLYNMVSHPGDGRKLFR